MNVYQAVQDITAAEACVRMADEICGKDAKIALMPDGVNVLVENAEGKAL